MSLLSRTTIMAADDRRHVDVDVPEWGGSVRIVTMTGTERDQFELDITQESLDGTRHSNYANFRSKLLARCIVGDDGVRLFTDADIGSLGSKSASVLDRLLVIAKALNALSPQDVAELTEGLKKDQNDDSTSDSPES